MTDAKDVEKAVPDYVNFAKDERKSVAVRSSRYSDDYLHDESKWFIRPSSIRYVSLTTSNVDYFSK
jgi:hypothetical protein